MIYLNNLDPIIGEQIADDYFEARERLEGYFFNTYKVYNIPLEKMAEMLKNKATSGQVEEAGRIEKLKTVRMTHQEFDEMTIKWLDKAKKS